jgi:hypothetical protein
MDEKPTGLAAKPLFVGFSADEQIWMYFDHARSSPSLKP